MHVHDQNTIVTAGCSHAYVVVDDSALPVAAGPRGVDAVSVVLDDRAADQFLRLSLEHAGVYEQHLPNTKYICSTKPTPAKHQVYLLNKKPTPAKQQVHLLNKIDTCQTTSTSAKQKRHLPNT